MIGTTRDCLAAGRAIDEESELARVAGELERLGAVTDARRVRDTAAALARVRDVVRLVSGAEARAGAPHPYSGEGQRRRAAAYRTIRELLR